MHTAVFPVAGRGTRFLPATKASPKEMLPIVDKPLIQYAVEEAIAAGAKKLVFITGSTKQAIEDHFTPDPELEEALAGPGKEDLLDSIRNILPPDVSCTYIDQGEPLGLGHAVLCARPAVGDEPFFVHLCDDLIAGEPPCLCQMAGEYGRHGGSVIAVEPVPPEDTSRYGIVAVNGESQRVTRIVEKPAPQDAPSNLAVVGRYLLSPVIFDKLENTGRGAGGEIQLTDAIADMLEESPVYAYPFSGERYDCGNKLGYLKATVAYGLAHSEIGGPFREHLRELIDRN
ncbi:MAG: UTP--glucose-1-phosphate uridylyltransferase GalU [Gammaproteobacteria bacterium]|nr:MAG: UTP--glucose-1-phosphate uridylyltransferase GalU [Gammaproteobacteria bacterium]